MRLIPKLETTTPQEDSQLLPHQLQLVSDLVPISQPPTNSVADGETFAFGDNFIVGGAQGGDLAAVDVLGVALERRDLVREVRCLLLLAKQPNLEFLYATSIKPMNA